MAAFIVPPMLLSALVVTALAAPVLAEPPRFEGSSTRASSADATRSSDVQDPTTGLTQAQTNALIGAAALEAAREEGLRILEERRAADDIGTILIAPGLAED